MTISDLLLRFEDVKKVSNEYKCKCPAHNDKKASLTVKDGGDKILLYCHSGCETRDILGAIGLKTQDLFINKVTRTEKFYNETTFVEFIKNIDFKGSMVTDVYPYRNESGEVEYYKFRTKNKDFNFIRYIDGNLIWGLSGGTYFEYSKQEFSKKEREGSKSIEVFETEKILYNLPKLIEGIRKGNTVFICEGEKDVNTLTKLGFYATSSPTGAGKGTQKWLDSYSEYFKGADIVILPDNDLPGKEFAKEVKKSLFKAGAFKIREWIASDKEKGDITDWYESLNNKDEAYRLIISNINNIKPEFAEWCTVTKKVNKDGLVEYNAKINKNRLAIFLVDKLNFEFIGNGQTSVKPIPHIYTNGVYEPCASITNVIGQYIHTSFDYDVDYRMKIQKLMKDLKRVENANSLDGCDYLVNFKNGLYDLRKGELLPHSPEYRTIFQVQRNYNAKPKNYGYLDKYIDDLSEGKEDHKRILQEMAGVILSNIPGHKLKTVFALLGAGNTGKGKFWEMIASLLGDRMVASQKLQDLDRGNFGTSVLYAKRFVYCGDLSEKGLSDVDIFKQITGGDKMSVQFKFGDTFSYLFNGVYACALNDMPPMTKDFGDHMYQRFTILNCNNVIPKERQNKNLIEEILKYDGDYFVSWALEGAKRVLDNNYNLSYCEDIEINRKKYKIQTESVYAFISEEFDITGNTRNDRIKFIDFKRLYIEWCEEFGKMPVSNIEEFKKRIGSIKGLILDKKYQNMWHVRGLKLKEKEVFTDDNLDDSVEVSNLF